MRNNPLAKSDISKDELGSHPQPQLSTNLWKHKVAPWRAREGNVVFNHVDAVLLLTSTKRIHTKPKAHRLLGYGFATYGRGRYGRPHHQTWYGSPDLETAAGAQRSDLYAKHPHHHSDIRHSS